MCVQLSDVRLPGVRLKAYTGATSSGFVTCN